MLVVEVLDQITQVDKVVELMLLWVQVEPTKVVVLLDQVHKDKVHLRVVKA